MIWIDLGIKLSFHFQIIKSSNFQIVFPFSNYQIFKLIIFLALLLNAADSYGHRSSMISFSSGIISGCCFDRFCKMVSEKAFMATAISFDSINLKQVFIISPWNAGG